MARERPLQEKSGPGAGPAQNRIRHYAAKEEITLLDCLVRHFGVTPEEGERLISFGAVYGNRQRIDSNRTLSAGEYVRVHLQPKRFPVGGVDWPATVVHRNERFIVVHKPAGIPVHATLDNQIENVLHQLRVALDVPLYITQRLDTEVSGLIVFARTAEFQRQFNRFLVERTVRKRYRALLASAPETGRFVHYMEPSERSPKTIRSEAHADWLECVLRVLSVKPAGCSIPAPHAFDVEIELETGRTHQIRAQLSALGSPIVGDKLYGSRTRYRVNETLLPGIALFSTSISWRGVDKKEWSFELSPSWQEDS